MDYKPWPDWIENGYCVHPGAGMEKMKVINHGLLKDFVKNNYIGDVIEVSKYNKYNKYDNPLFNLNRNKCLKISTREEFVDYKSIPDDTFRAKITGIYCGKGTWRIKADLIDFKLLEPVYDLEDWDKPPTYSEHKIRINVEGYPDSIKQIIRNHTQLRLALKKLAFVSGTHERLGDGSLLEGLPIDIIEKICSSESLNILSGGDVSGGGKSKKNKKKSKKHKRSSRNYKSKKRKRSSRNLISKRRR